MNNLLFCSVCDNLKRHTNIGFVCVKCFKEKSIYNIINAGRRIKIKTIRRKPIKSVRRRIKGLTALEIYHLKKFVKKNIDLDLLDFNALVDKTLTYSENKEILDDHINGKVFI